MWATGTKTNLRRLWNAQYIKQVRVGENSFITVARVVPHHQFLTFFNVKAIDVGVLCCSTTEVNNGRGVTHNFFYSGLCVLVEVVPPNVTLVGVVGKKFHAMANCVAGCLVAGNYEENKE